MFQRAGQARGGATRALASRRRPIEPRRVGRVADVHRPKLPGEAVGAPPRPTVMPSPGGLSAADATTFISPSNGGRSNPCRGRAPVFYVPARTVQNGGLASKSVAQKCDGRPSQVQRPKRAAARSDAISPVAPLRRSTAGFIGGTWAAFPCQKAGPAAAAERGAAGPRSSVETAKPSAPVRCRPAEPFGRSRRWCSLSRPAE